MSIRKKPFYQSPLATNLKAGLVGVEQFKKAVLELDPHEFSQFIRIYVEEGIPAAFYGEPILWEGIRDFLAIRLEISAKEVAMVGSGKTGFSCNPVKFGQPFSKKSDLDFSIINNKLFDDLARDVRLFIGLIDSSGLMANSQKVFEIWQENVRVLSRNMKYGFIDSYLIPSDHERFPKAAKLNNEASILRDRLLVTAGHEVESTSFRVYESWDSFSDRVKLNFTDIRKKLSVM